MTEEIIINDVNVSECKYFNKVVNEEPYCNIDEEHLYTCSSDENCYFKQLKRLEIEIEKLKGVDGSVHPDSAYYKITRLVQENNSLQAQLNNITVQSNNAITALEQENKELKEENIKVKKEFNNLIAEIISDIEYTGEIACNGESPKEHLHQMQKALASLEEINILAKNYCNACDEFKAKTYKNKNDCLYCNYGFIKRKINEVLNENKQN